MSTIRLGTRIATILAAVLLVLTTAQPATADGNYGVAKMRVKSAKTVASSAIIAYQVGTGQTHRIVIRASGSFTKHTTNSVKLTTVKLCYSETGGGSEYLRPFIRVGGKTIVWKGKSSYNVASGACRKYTVNKTFKAKPKKELFVLVTKLGVSQMDTVHGVYR